MGPDVELASDPPPSDALWVAAWLAAWLIPFGVFQLVLIPSGYGMFGQSWVSGLWFAGATVVGVALFRRELLRPAPAETSGPAIAPLLVLGAVAVLVGLVYAWARTGLPATAELFEACRDRQLGVVRMDAVYLAAKLPELVFQQAMILVLVRRLLHRGHRGLGLVGAFAAIFGTLHFLVIPLKGWAGIPIVAASFGAALIFPPLIARFRGGVGYSLSVHWLAYLVAGVAIRAGGCGPS